MNCQLKSLEHAVSELLLRQIVLRELGRRFFPLLKPLLSKVTRIIGRLLPSNNKIHTRQGDVQSIEPLHLKSGEKVRVKSYEDIVLTLDDNKKYQGLAFTPAQKQYCGRVFTVLKRLENVFDERRWKMFRIEHTVLLENVVCDGKGGAEKEWNGCDRNCLLWWKEAWLERVDK